MPDINVPLQIRPSGLLGFLDIKRAAAPVQLLPNLSPEIDLRRWYLETNTEQLSEAAGAAAIGQNAFVTVVPANEYWHLSAFVVGIAAFGLGDSLINGFPWAIPAGLGIPIPLDRPITLTGTATSGVFSHGVFCDVFLAPGSSFGYTIFDAAAGFAFTLQPQWRFTRLPF